jgi:RNA polymerase sigma-70 factor (family 1)
MIDAKEVAELQTRIALSDDQTAYVRLYRIYFASLLSFARSFVKLQPVAEEIVSDVFLQVWQRRKEIETINNLTVYLYTSIRNHSLNYLTRQKRRGVTYLFDEVGLPVTEMYNDPEQIFITMELVKEIDKAVRQLPPKCRMIFQLVREDGLKYREVAEVLNISIKTVETQMGIAVKKIGEAIKPLTGTQNKPAVYRFQSR